MLKSIKAFLSNFYCNADLRKEIKTITGFCPRKIKYYKLALVHKSASFVAQDGKIINNERLEFLGDAVLGATVAEYLYLKYPDISEGELTKMRSRLVNGSNLEKFSKESGIANLIVTRANLRRSIHITGDTVEALIGAIFLDRGFKKARRFIINKLIGTEPSNDRINTTDYNYKSEIIEWCQHKKRGFNFTSIQHPSSSNHRPLFISNLKIDDNIAGVGVGRSKKDAEQAAAREALYGVR